LRQGQTESVAIEADGAVEVRDGEVGFEESTNFGHGAIVSHLSSSRHEFNPGEAPPSLSRNCSG